MKDRYLFRGKRIDNGEWVIGNLVNSPDGRVAISETGGDWKLHECIPTTICQCTGLEDKNGKLIWENDVVEFQFDNDDCPFPNKDTKKRIGKVFFSDFRASWSIAMGRNGAKYINNDLFRYVQNGNRVEVICSAIDNLELLEVQE